MWIARFGGITARLVVFEQDAMGGAVKVVELPRPKCPQEGKQTEKAQKQCGGNEPQQNVQSAYLRFNLSEFTITTIEDVDMAMAAINGVTRPATAIGTVIPL